MKQASPPSEPGVSNISTGSYVNKFHMKKNTSNSTESDKIKVIIEIYFVNSIISNKTKNSNLNVLKFF